MRASFASSRICSIKASSFSVMLDILRLYEYALLSSTDLLLRSMELNLPTLRIWNLLSNVELLALTILSISFVLFINVFELGTLRGYKNCRVICLILIIYHYYIHIALLAFCNASKCSLKLIRNVLNRVSFVS